MVCNHIHLMLLTTFIKQSFMQIFNLKRFSKYSFTGIVNSVVHWMSFLFLYYKCDAGQTLSNIAAFSFAVTFSFLVNSKFTFTFTMTCSRYRKYISFIAIMSAFFGWGGQTLRLPPLITLFLFSLFSLFFGYLYLSTSVFRGIK
jgi:putative flippase GtrA